jgi:hypothetical protein
MIEGLGDEVKELTLSYMAFASPIRQIHGVRWVGLAACVLVSTASAAPRASNPAFLGIQMHDASGAGPCQIDFATQDGPAEAAGLRRGDLVISVDGKPISNCAALLAAITSRAPGESVEIKVQRFPNTVVARAQLTTRDALLRKMIGKPMAETHFVGVEDGTEYDLSALNGRMAIVGLYNPACVECASLFSKFVAWSRATARRGGPRALVLAVAVGDTVRDRDLKAMQRALDVPLAAGAVVPGRDAESALLGRELVIADAERLGVLVIDGRGIVQYLGPIAPGGDDIDAVLEELFEAADHASRRPS